MCWQRVCLKMTDKWWTNEKTPNHVTIDHLQNLIPYGIRGDRNMNRKMIPWVGTWAQSSNMNFISRVLSITDRVWNMYTIRISYVYLFYVILIFFIILYRYLSRRHRYLFDLLMCHSTNFGIGDRTSTDVRHHESASSWSVRFNV